MFGKLHIRILAATMATVMCWSCVESGDMTDAGAYTMSLRLSSGETTTRTSTDATGTASAVTKAENAIDRVDLFFFPTGADESVYHYSANNVGGSGEQDLTVPFQTNILDALFGENGNKCDVFAVVNTAAAAKLGDKVTRAYLAGIVVSEPFENSVAGGFIEGMSNFVMYNPVAEVVTLDRAARRATGTIKVRHVAAKIRIAVDPQTDVYIDADGNTITQGENESYEEFIARAKEHWRVQPDNMRAFVANGTKSARIDGTFGDETSGFTPDYYNTSAQRMLAAVDGSSLDNLEGKWYWNQVPFYSHPNEWPGMPTTDNDYKRTYLTVVVPWGKEEHPLGSGRYSVYEPTYYQVPINVYGDSQGNNSNSLQSNHYYRVRVHIGMLGSFTPEEEVELTPSYEIVEWGQENIDVDITQTRYLVVNQTDWDVNGEESVTIPFYSSHDVEVVSINVEYYRYNDNWSGRSYLGEVHKRTFNNAVNEETKSKNNGEGIYSYTLDNVNRTLTITHPMVLWSEYMYTNNNKTQSAKIGNTDVNDDTDYFSDKTTTPEYSKYIFTIVIRHTDMGEGTAYEETITITQYPSIYIEVERNPGDGDVNQYTFANANNNNTTTGNWDFIDRLTKNFTGTNENPNMYVIHITQLSAEDDSKYDLGDPRTLDYNINLSDNSFGSNATGNNNPHTRWNRTTNIFGRNNGTNYSRISAFIWATSRNQSSSNGTYTYSNYNYVPSMYADLKPNNEGNNNNNTNFANYVNNKNNLCYYYPTDETAEDEAGSKASFIAPVIRVASSFGRTYQFDKASSRRRCASYQEAGYPAGRWRIPTRAEIEYIVGLSAAGKIPVLFGGTGTSANSTVYYWTSTGAIGVNSSTGTVTIPSSTSNISTPGIRCVYDEWYWVKEDGTPDKCDISTFTWGDKPKVNPQN